MQNISPEQINKRYSSLAKPLQDAFFSEKTEGAVNKACVLREAEGYTAIIAKLMGRVLLGYLRLENFAAEIQKETGIELTKAQLIAHDIDAEVFSNVRLELKKLYPPVIQTPTVQSWTSQKNQQPTPAPSASSGQAQPKYIIPIPEKFMKRETWNTKQELGTDAANAAKSGLQRPSQYSAPPASPDKLTPVAKESAGGGLTSAEPSQPTQTQQKPEIPKSQTADSDLQATSYKLQANFKPVVPLPTFIRSQFKAEEPPKMANADNKKTEVKEFASKFSAPDPTVAKPISPKEDQYREKV